MNQGINVLSFFDGISAGQEALKQLGVKVDRYIAIEIDQSATAITQANFPKTEQRGDILLLHTDMKNFVAGLPKIDLIFAGSPCQGFSKSGKGKGFDHPRSKLFFTFVEILTEIKSQQSNPDIPFFFENVVMDDEWAEEISKSLGVKEEVYDAVDYSPNARERYFWTNLRPPRAIIEKYKQEGGWKTYQDILDTITPSSNRVVYKPLFSNTKSSTAKNKIFWASERKTTLKLGTLYHQKSQGKSFYKINGKMPTFTSMAFSINSGLGSYAFPKLFWEEKNENNIFDRYKKLKNGKEPTLYFDLPKEIQKRWNLPSGEYMVFYPSYKEALKAMGFNPNYFKGVEFDRKKKNTKKFLSLTSTIGNSWHVTIVKLLIEWYCRSNGWIGK
jgi:site-specific DNA-cytosine methylase